MVRFWKILILGTIGLLVLMTQWASFVRAESPSNGEDLVNAAGAAVESADEPSGRSVSDSPYDIKRANQFLRIGRGSHFIRIGRGGASSFLRIGRNPLSQFVRIGKAPSSMFLRIGKSSAAGNPELGDLAAGPSSLDDSNIDEDEVLKRASSFLRIGRSNPSTFLRIGKSAGNLDEETATNEDIVTDDIDIPSESVAKRANAFLRIGKIPASSFVRIGRGPYGIDNRSNPRGFLSVGSRFVRIGKREAIPSETGPAHARLLPNLHDQAQ